MLISFKIYFFKNFLLLNFKALLNLKAREASYLLNVIVTACYFLRYLSKIYSCYRSKFKRDAKSLKVTILEMLFPEMSPAIEGLRFSESVIRVIGHNRPINI